MALLPAAQSGWPGMKSTPGTIQRTESHESASKFGRPWIIRANSLKERNVVHARYRTETDVKEERNAGKRGWRGMYGSGLSFGGSDSDFRRYHFAELSDRCATYICLRLGSFWAKMTGKSAKMLVVVCRWYPVSSTSYT